MGARFAPFSFGGLLLQSYRPHLTQASCTHRTGIPSTSNLVDSMNTLFVNNEKMKLRCVQMMVRLVAEKRLGEENRKAGKNSWGVHSRHKESPRKHSVFKGLWSDCPKTIIDIGEISGRSRFGRRIIGYATKQWIWGGIISLLRK